MIISSWSAAKRISNNAGFPIYSDLDVVVLEQSVIVIYAEDNIVVILIQICFLSK